MPATVSLMVSGDEPVQMWKDGDEDEKTVNPGQTWNFTLSGAEGIHVALASSAPPLLNDPVPDVKSNA